MNDVEEAFGRLDADATTGYGRDSTIRRVACEPAVALLIPRALTLEVAHPKIAAGVRDHSRFRAVPWRRLWATSDVAARILWGDAATAHAAAAQVYRFHDHINGTVEAAGLSDAAASYTAHDATLLVWVWATLVDTLRCGYERWVAPFTDAEADAFYADMTTFALFFGIPRSLVPSNRVEFDAYLDGVLDGDGLTPTSTSRAVVHDVLWFQHRLVPSAVVHRLRVLSIGTLDPRLRARFGLQLSEPDEELFTRLDGQLKRYYRQRSRLIVSRLPDVYIGVRKLTLREPRRRSAVQIDDRVGHH